MFAMVFYSKTSTVIYAIGLLLKNISSFYISARVFGAGISLSAGIDEELTKVLIITHEYLEDICLKDITCFAFLY